MANTIRKSISITKVVKDKLKEISHPGQSYDGIIRELLQQAGSPVSTDVRGRNYSG